MERLKYGTKVLVFDNPSDKIYGGYRYGTIVNTLEDNSDSSELKDYEIEYTIRDDKEPDGLYLACKYYSDIMTPEDYKKYLSKELTSINNSIKRLHEKNRKLSKKIRNFTKRENRRNNKTNNN